MLIIDVQSIGNTLRLDQAQLIKKVDETGLTLKKRQVITSEPSTSPQNIVG